MMNKKQQNEEGKAISQTMYYNSYGGLLPRVNLALLFIRIQLFNKFDKLFKYSSFSFEWGGGSTNLWLIRFLSLRGINTNFWLGVLTH